MTRRSSVGIAVVGTLTLVSQFVCLPVFANDSVNISIVEEVDDGDGGFKPWEDITDAMPGTAYSVIPRVRNGGSLPVSVRICVIESVVDSLGNLTDLQSNFFEINTNKHWTKDGDSSDLALQNCYNYDSVLEVGAVTEPLFSEVTLSEELGNVYKNGTFGLRLSAEATWGEAPSPVEPDTGFNTVSYFDIVSPVVFTAGGIVAFAVIAYVIRYFYKKN